MRPTHKNWAAPLCVRQYHKEKQEQHISQRQLHPAGGSWTRSRCGPPAKVVLRCYRGGPDQPLVIRDLPLCYESNIGYRMWWGAPSKSQGPGNEMDCTGGGGGAATYPPNCLSKARGGGRIQVPGPAPPPGGVTSLKAVCFLLAPISTCKTRESHMNPNSTILTNTHGTVAFLMSPCATGAYSPNSPLPGPLLHNT